MAVARLPGTASCTGFALAAGALAAARARMAAAVVVMRGVLVISTCLLWLVDRRVRSVRRGGCVALVDKRSIAVDDR